MKYLSLLTIIAGIFVLSACSKTTVEPELFGNISGSVLNADTNAGVANVSITTQPATNAILTDKNGVFELKNVSTGSYTITADKPGYISNTVSITVRENETSTARILLKPDDSQQKKQYLQAEVTSWAETTSNDSSFVNVEYRVMNNSDGTDIGKFEVYFGIYSSGDDFYYEVRDSSLSAGETSIGDYTKYVRQATIDSVTVTGTWVAG